MFILYKFSFFQDTSIVVRSMLFQKNYSQIVFIFFVNFLQFTILIFFDSLSIFFYMYLMPRNIILKYMEELMNALVCRTLLTRKTVRALAKYHTKNNNNKRKSIFIFLLGIFLLIVSMINSYGLWMKYHELKSISYIILKSSVLYMLSFVILHTSIWGSTQKLYIELNNYFSRQKAKYIDYTISEEGITLTLTNNSTLYNWSSISLIEFDNNYYYFTCDGKCSIIDKKDMNSFSLQAFESLISENNISFYNLH